MLEYATLGWNAVAIVILTIAALQASSVALAGFGLDSLIEIGASTVVIWELSDASAQRQRQALRLIGLAFLLLAVYLLVLSSLALLAEHRPSGSNLGLVWVCATALVMFALAWGKVRTGRALGNPVLTSEGRVTLVDGLLASAVVLGLLLTSVFGWWWTDALIGYVIAGYALRETVVCLRS